LTQQQQIPKEISKRYKKRPAKETDLTSRDLSNEKTSAKDLKQICKRDLFGEKSSAKETYRMQKRPTECKRDLSNAKKPAKDVKRDLKKRSVERKET